jgi:PIN domain nuclease of toxin-antitoxin system
MRLLLDTVTFVWAAVSPERLSHAAMLALRNESAVRELSVISVTEIAIKQALGKFSFGQNDLIQGVYDLQVRFLPYTANHAFQLFELPLHHSDPFDREIIAQALAEDIPVVTADEKFRLYKGVEIIW